MTINAPKNFVFDAAVPQREQLLDAQEAAKIFRGYAEIDSCERLRVKYRIGHNLRVSYKLQIAGETRIVACRTFTNEGSEKAYELAKGCEKFEGSLPPVFYNPDLKTVFWAFPNDRKIKGLDLIERPSFPSLPEWKESRLAAYAPEKCATFQCLSGAGEILAYAKIYGETGAEKFYKLYKHIENAPFLSPRAIDFKNNFLLLSAVKGEKLAELTGDKLLAGFRKLGESLALVHSFSPPKGLPEFKRLDISILKKSADIIGIVRPDVSKDLERLMAGLFSFYVLSDSKRAFLHSDVHPKNAILNGDQLHLIDFDQAAIGDISADIGSFLASLKYSRIIGAVTESQEKVQVGEFLKGYEGIAKLPGENSIRWHVAASLLAERALRAVNRIRPEGLMKLDCVLGESITVLEGRSNI